MDEFLERMKILGIILTLAAIILHLTPGTEYDKYIRQLVALVVAFYLCMPLISFFYGDYAGNSKAFTETIIDSYAWEMQTEGRDADFTEVLRQETDERWMQWWEEMWMGSEG